MSKNQLTVWCSGLAQPGLLATVVQVSRMEEPENPGSIPGAVVAIVLFLSLFFWLSC